MNERSSRSAGDVGRGGDDDSGRGRALAAAFSRLDRDRRLHHQQMALGAADLRILWLFTDGRARTMREIADELHLEQSTVNRQVNAAVDVKLLERSRPDGGGAYVFMRTPGGRVAFEADVALSLGGYRAALEAMGDAEASEFLRLLDRFTLAYGDVAGAAQAR